MRTLARCVFASLVLTTPALAQTPVPVEPTPTPASVPMPGTTTTTTTQSNTSTDGSSSTTTSTASTATTADVTASSGETKEEETKKKEPKRGDFNAGGQVRLPNGPGDDGKYATFNWVALDAKGKYYLLKWVTIDGTIPLAVKKPDTVGPMGVEPSVIGGITTRLEAKTPPIKVPFVKQKSEVGIALGAAYMREGAMLLSERDFPLFVGDFQPGATVGVISKIKLGKVVDFNFSPQWVWQKGSDENLSALQIPLSLVVAAGDMIKLGTELGIYTGDDYSFSADEQGRISTGVSLDVKIGRIVTHAGIGFASLLTDEMGMYPSIKESMYVDVNVKFAK